MVHQVAADHVRAVRDTVREIAVRGHQQDLRRLDAVRGDHEVLAFDAMVGARLVLVDRGGDALVRPGLELVDDRAVDQLRAGLLGLLDVHDAVVHRADRADRHAVVVPATSRPAVVRAAVARDRLGHHVELRVIAVERALDRLLVERQRQRRHRVRLLARRVQVFLGPAPHAEFLFGALVVMLDVVVLDRPVAADAVHGLHLEVVRDEAPRRRGPVPRRAAYRADVLRVELVLALQDQVVVRRAVFRMRRPRARRVRRHEVGLVDLVAEALDDFPARHARAGFQQDHGLARHRELVRDDRACDTRPDDDDVGLLRIGIGHQACLSIGFSAQKPGLLGQYDGITSVSDTTLNINASS